MKLYKGTKLALFHPIQDVLVVDTSERVVEGIYVDSSSNDDVDTGKDTVEQKRSVVTKISLPFFDRCLGQTSVVKHNILTEEPPIRQKYQCIPNATKPVVISEMKKMLDSE